MKSTIYITNGQAFQIDTYINGAVYLRSGKGITGCKSIADAKSKADHKAQ